HASDAATASACRGIRRPGLATGAPDRGASCTVPVTGASTAGFGGIVGDAPSLQHGKIGSYLRVVRVLLPAALPLRCGAIHLPTAVVDETEQEPRLQEARVALERDAQLRLRTGEVARLEEHV